MAQHDYDINSSDSISGLQFRADINAVLSAIKSSNSGITAPATTTAGMLWFDTSATPAILKQRDKDNLDWLPVGGENTIGASVAAATTTSIGSTGQGDLIVISGNTTITSFGTGVTGVKRTLVFTGIPTVTHGTDLVLPGASNILVVSGTVLEMVCTDGTLGHWLCTSMQHPDVSFNELVALDGLQTTLDTKVGKDSDTGVVYLTSGTTAQRPILADGVVGIRYNTTSAASEVGVGTTGATTWSPVGGGATGGGGDTVFIENEYTITTSYTIPAGKSAVTVADANGDIHLNAGVEITFADTNSRLVVL